MMAANKKCSRCGTVKSIGEFSPDHRQRDGLRCSCKKCQCESKAAWYRENKERAAEYRKCWSRNNRDKIRRSHIKYRERHPAQRTAGIIVGNALRSGRLTRPDVCSACGHQHKLQAHHPDYAKPLEVVWLCHKCHTALHRVTQGQCLAANR